MSITYRVLGAPGRDNALFVQIDSGQAVERLLFDCGDGCLADFTPGDVRAIHHVFFSHLHMDHVGGFDTFFRCTFDGDNRVWGPPDTARILHHRFRGFLWNLHEGMTGTWRVSDVFPDRVRTTRFELAEAFADAHDDGERPYERIVCEGAGYTVEAVTMDHRTPTLAYVVREKPRQNVDAGRLAAMGLKPGPWMKHLKEPSGGAAEVAVGGTTYSPDELRRALVVETAGESVAYLTDFLLDEPATDRLAQVLRGCRTVVCEAQYRHADAELAARNYHMTTVQAATLARRAGVGELVLFHLSDRYDRAAWADMLREAREVFPAARFPDG
jgi:ribonuclease Z